jgi:N-acyl-D-aspartate/D-glutamate deacylase
MSIVNDSFSMFDAEGNFMPVETAYEDYVGHPRIAGSRGKCLRIAREDKIPLMLVVNNAGAFPAKMLCASGVEQMCVRGKIQPGMIADITIFDPKTVKENSDYAPGKNGLPTTGIPYVLVSGKIVVRDSKVDLKMRAGKAIRAKVIE